MTCAFSWTKGHLHKHPTPPPPILMGFSEGKLCSDSFIHVMFLKRMSKTVLVSTLILLLFFIFPLFQFMLVFIWFVYISEQGYMSILLLKWIFFHSTWLQHFPFDHNYILVFALFLGWQYMFFFSSGQSNPTFCLSKNGKKFVLRKKPPGKLLRGAHQVCVVHTLYFCSLIL